MKPSFAMGRFTISLSHNVAMIMRQLRSGSRREKGPSSELCLDTCSRQRPVAFAADAAMPVKAPPISSVYDWTGFYVGGHFGWGLSTQPMNLSMAPGDVLSEPYRASGMLGGLQAGYNYQLPNRVVLGVEADVTFADTFGKRGFADANFGGGQFISNLQYFGTARARLGYALGSGWGWMMPYITAGFAWGENKAEVDFADGTVQTKSLAHLGWTAGAGVEFPIGDRWTAKAEYHYVDLGAKTYDNFSLDEMRPGAGSSLTPQMHAFLLGLNYRPFANPLPKDQWPGADWDNWSIHGQATYIEQGYRSFNSPYQGTNSLSGASQMRNTVSSTAFIGRKVWDGGEVYFNPEISQGFGLSDTVGAAGYPNGEAQKSDFPVPHPNVARVFLRQTFGFGGAQEDVEDSANQIAGKRDISRLTVTAGKFSVTDIFDDNAYAHDPRTTFMNWSIWEAGAFDYAADQVGYTWGAVAELNQKDWAAREPAISSNRRCRMRTRSIPRQAMAATSARSSAAIRCSRSPASCACSASSTSIIPAATARRWPTPRSASTSPRPARRAPNTASSSTSSRPSTTISASFPARAGTTATTRSWRSPISIAAFRSAPSPRAPPGAGRTTRSASRRRSTRCRGLTAISSPPAGSAS